MALKDADYLNSDDTYKILSEITSKVQSFASEVTEWHENVGKKLSNEKRNEIQERVDNWKPKDDRYGFGTGFYIDEHYILTNAHVVTKDNDRKHKYNDFRIPYRRVKLIKWDPDVDLALLYDERGNTDTATFRNLPIDVGEDIVLFGYPLSHVLSYRGNGTMGIVSGLSAIISDFDSDDHFQHTAPQQGATVEDLYLTRLEMWLGSL